MTLILKSSTEIALKCQYSIFQIFVQMRYLRHKKLLTKHIHLRWGLTKKPHARKCIRHQKVPKRLVTASKHHHKQSPQTHAIWTGGDLEEAFKHRLCLALPQCTLLHLEGYLRISHYPMGINGLHHCRRTVTGLV